MGDEGAEKCLSQHKCLPRHFPRSCSPPSVAPGRGSGVGERRELPVHAAQHTLLHAAPGCCFPVGISGVRLSDTSGTHFPEASQESCAFLGSRFGQRWLKGQLAGAFPCRKDGNPSRSSAASRTPELLSSTRSATLFLSGRCHKDSISRLRVFK